MTDVVRRLRAAHGWARRSAEVLVRRGDRTLLWTPQLGPRFGNFLYYWLRAHARQQLGVDYRVLHAPAMEPWLELLPEIRRDLVLNRGDVRFADRREFTENAVFGSDFTRDELHSFIREYVVGSDLVGHAPSDSGLLVVNVRRGDYYSFPPFRGLYGFDIPAYLEVALPRALSLGPAVREILVVSDGIDWCRLKLDGLLRRFAPVEYADPEASAEENFRQVATAQRIVGTNSTFSYWGGYVSNVLHGADSHVTMPAFHARQRNGGRAYQLDPTWDIVHEIPGGWDV